MSLDRCEQGIVQKCCECSRQYLGEAWMGYCSECHAENERTSPLNKRWACLNCGWKGKAGEMYAGAGPSLECPKCRSSNTSSAEGVRDVPEYHGEIGTRN
jgi:hypothetical protein